MTPVIDYHVHLAALPTGRNGCMLSPRMRRSPITKMLAWRQGLPLDDPETANRRYLERLAEELGRSERVGKAVLLGLDGVYDPAGKLDEGGTNFLISNDAVLEAAAGNDRFLAGVSINPRRRDAVDELERCAEKGAFLVKWLPNAQGFDPGEKSCVPFYRALAKRSVPLLSHVGFEFSLIGRDQSVGNPERLIPALEEGATVIAAHGCSSGILIERHFDTMLELAGRYERFFVDTSALTLPNRVRALLKIRRRPELFERLVFGTDYPLDVFSYPALLGGSLRGFLSARSSTNRFDRQARVLDSLGIKLGSGPQ